MPLNRQEEVKSIFYEKVKKNNNAFSLKQIDIDDGPDW